jgi:hypothetical protein
MKLQLKCWVCKKEITERGFQEKKATYIGWGKYRHNKCKYKSIVKQAKIYKKIRKTWSINPVTKIKPNTKKKSRSKIKQQFIKEINE